MTAITRLFRVETYLLRLCARTPSLWNQQPRPRCEARLTLEGRLDFAYLLLHNPEVCSFLVSRFTPDTNLDLSHRLNLVPAPRS